MKNASILIIILIAAIIPLQTSCAQNTPCPTNNTEAQKELKEYLSKERNIKSLHNQYDMPISNSAEDLIKSLSVEENRKECQQLRGNLEWLKEEDNYSIYKVAEHYFIVIYSFDQQGEFQIDEIPIVNSDYKAIGSIIDLGNLN